ncbi:MAG: PDZ domain-containing protein [Rhodothermaceae bacterium]
MKKMLLSLFIMLMASVSVSAQVDGKMLRQPDVSETHITFVYAGDIWIVSKTGGVAQRLSSPKGEESFPRFSPDGKTIAFSGNYDGNTDVYTIPLMGGEVTRLTYHPYPDRVVNWTPDGKSILFASVRESGSTRFDQLYTMSLKGGMAEKLPIPYGSFGAYSPDMKKIAYMPETRDFRTWKRYRGGGASEIFLFDLKDFSSENISDNDAVDGHPMWYGDFIYFLSDRGEMQRSNIWKYNKNTKKYTQVTFFKNFDVTFPAIGKTDIVFEAGGNIHLLNLKNEKLSKVNIDIVSDFATLKPYQAKVGNAISGSAISPDGKRVVFNARGEMFTVPVKHGFTKNLTQSSGVNEIYPAWSPDGKNLAYWSDKTGEYELYIKKADGSGEEKKLTDLGKGFRYQPIWSPDSKKIFFIENQNYMMIYDIEEDELTKVDRQYSLTHPALQGFSIDWSADSKWITYTKQIENKQTAIFLYSLEKAEKYQVTSGFYADNNPVFDPAGKYLYFVSNRSLSPVYSSLDATWIYPNSSQIVAVSLRKDVPSPLAPRNDEVKIKKEDKKKKGDKKKDAKKKDKKELKIDLDGFENRLVVLVSTPGRYGNLAAVKGKLLYSKYPNSGSGSRSTSVNYYDFKARKSQNVLNGVRGFEVTADGKQIFVMDRRGQFHVAKIAPKQKLKKPIKTSDMIMTVVPREEWKEMFTDVWRRYRDFFYDGNMQGVDWDQMKENYGKLLEDAVTRWDVNFVMGNLIAELNSSHTYVFGGQTERGKYEGVGLLGVDWELANGAYRIKKIIDGADWDNDVRSPFKLPGVKVKEGDYILAVNGIEIDINKEPYAAFEGVSNKVVELTVNSKPTMEGAKKVLVKTMRRENGLRYNEWVNNNRKMVEKLSGGKIGYIYMPNTGGRGQTELIRQYYGQLDKKGFIVDERFNGGGQLPDRFIELLTRKPGHLISRRNGDVWTSFDKSNTGPKVMLINGWAVSGGDAFPYVFKDQKVGKIVGTRTAGGLIGPATGHRLMDGGGITVPGGRIYDYHGKWFPESWGVEPDIYVDDDPTQLAKGVDPQLKRAVEEAMKMLKDARPKTVPVPEMEDATHRSAK